MNILAELLAEHLELEKLGDRLMAVVRAPIADAAAVAAVRWQLCRAFVDHWEREDRYVYDLLLSSGDAEATAAAQASRRTFGELREDMRRYVTEWPVDRIARDWGSFQAHTYALARQIDGRRASEETELYAHARKILARRAA